MNERQLAKFDIDVFIMSNINKNAAEIYIECLKEDKRVKAFPIKNKTPLERYESGIILKYGRFLDRVANAFGGFNNSFDLNDIKGCFNILKEGK